MIIGRDLIESQKLYSTGDDDLDELLERAFCDGYEYAQKEFSTRKYVGAAADGASIDSDYIPDYPRALEKRTRDQLQNISKSGKLSPKRQEIVKK